MARTVAHGFHLSIAGKRGVAGAVEEAMHLGLTAFQIFTKSPRSWRTRPLSPKEVEDFRALKEMAGEIPAVIHASYLVNLGAEGELWEKSVQSLADDLEKARLLGVEYVVVHPGSGAPERVKEGALKALKLAGVRQKPTLLLENTAGGGEKVGARFEELAWLLEDTPLGACLDTCHAFAAGYDVREDPGGVLSELDRTVGLDRVFVVHLNDSQGDLGSRIDHHAHLLQGRIGEGLKGVLLDPRLKGKVFILETPRSPEEDAWNLKVLRGWLED
ncbi:apurinic endonuclease APN1 [Thermus oshimai JL-2]|uniref:Probable endonuclease 4 n=1 Tax=Thermus oshimai JL-2 TaxID=751945 RepID=K7R6C9_THEOS|nr:endonuclease IV [Thermus oshimai]AFV76499.1 apurinic endonuclease APN1 [Thermus oshimai JL-2]